MRLVVALGLSLILCAAALPQAAAAPGDKLRLGMFGSGKAVGPLLTRAELRECFVLQGRIKSGTDTAAADREQLQKEKTEYSRPCATARRVIYSKKPTPKKSLTASAPYVKAVRR